MAGSTIRAVPRGRIAVKGLPDGVETYELLGPSRGVAAAHTERWMP